MARRLYYPGHSQFGTPMPGGAAALPLTATTTLLPSRFCPG